MNIPIQNTENGELVHYWLASGVLGSGGAMHGDGLAMQLYRTCLDTMQEICQQRASLSEKRSSRGPTEHLREGLGTLYLWGESFAPGQLDKVLNHAEDLRTVVIKALQQIGRLLLYSVKSQETRSSGFDNLQNLTTLIDQARTIISQMSDERFQKDDCSDSEPDSDEDDVLPSDDLEDLARGIQSQTSHLVRVGPIIQKTLMCAEKAEAQSPFPPELPFKVSDPANSYVSSVGDKSKQAQDHLIPRLGEANWQRHHRVGNSGPLDYAENATAFFRPYSAFHGSGMGTSIPDHTEYAASHISFLSSKSETKLGDLRVLQSPQRIIENKKFCYFRCGQTKVNTTNHVGWKMHVFADLKPFICIFVDCEVELARFSRRAAWAEHEFSQHLITYSWWCSECGNDYSTWLLYSEHLQKMHQRKYSPIGLQIAADMVMNKQEIQADKEGCPLCRLVPGYSRQAFVKHVGQHMEQIALMALFRDTEESETSEPDAIDNGIEGKVFVASRSTIREIEGCTIFALDNIRVNDTNRAKFTTKPRQEVANVRPIDACTRCRNLKIPCSGESPCKACRRQGCSCHRQISEHQWIRYNFPRLKKANLYTLGTNHWFRLLNHMIFDSGTEPRSIWRVLDSEHDLGILPKLVREKSNKGRQMLPWLPELTQSTESKSTSFLLEFDRRKAAPMSTPEEPTDMPGGMLEAGSVQDIDDEENVSSNSDSKPSDETFVASTRTEEPVPRSKSRSKPLWTPVEEQMLREMRDAGETWGEIAKVFPRRTEGIVKKHWYKDMHCADSTKDDARELLPATEEIQKENVRDTWKPIKNLQGTDTV